jgi:hypothetical protein
MKRFYPSPEEAERRKREREEEIRQEWRAFEEKVAAKRKETGCYRKDGLYELKRYAEGAPHLAAAAFVDGSFIYLCANREIHAWETPSLCPPLSMAKKWLRAGGEQTLKAIIAKEAANLA